MTGVTVPALHPEQAETLERMGSARNYNRWLVERGAGLVGARVLDAGAGIGTFTALVSEGRTVVALEPDPAFRQALRRRFADCPNVEIVGTGIEEFERSAPATRFDTILCFNVLEHLADDVAALRRFGRLLEPRGALLLLVPAHPGAYGRTDEVLGHERRYKRRELATKLAEAGLEVEQLRHVNPVGVLGWFVSSRLLRRSELPAGELRLYDRLVPVLRALDRLHLPFGLSLWAVGCLPG